MNANRVIDMIVRQVMRRLVNKGIDKGIDMASHKGDSSNRAGQASAPLHAQSLRQAQRVTRQMRRFMKF